MQISETIDGQVAITQDGVTIMLSREQAYSIFKWLLERRGWFRGKDDEQATIIHFINDESSDELTPEELAMAEGEFLATHGPQTMQQRMQHLADHITGGDTTIYKTEP
jgi:hypothetical protein